MPKATSEELNTLAEVAAAKLRVAVMNAGNDTGLALDAFQAWSMKRLEAMDVKPTNAEADLLCLMREAPRAILTAAAMLLVVADASRELDAVAAITTRTGTLKINEYVQEVCSVAMRCAERIAKLHESDPRVPGSELLH